MYILTWPNKWVCYFLGHNRVERESFSVWSSTDIMTGEILESGHKTNKPWIFCIRCGKDLADVGNKT